MRFILVLILSVLVMSCTVLQKKEDHLKDWELFSQIIVGRDTRESAKVKVGEPSAIDSNGKEEEWSYFRGKVPKIWVYFENGLLESASMDVWEGEEVLVLSYLLDRFQGKWKVEKEPVTIPHAMPSKCYLIDELQGKEIEIDGYKKSVVSISKRNPKISQEEWRGTKKLKTYSGWDHDHCAWLKDFLKTKGLLANGEKIE